MAEQHRKVTLYLFLLAVFLFLVVIIVTRGYKETMASTEYSNATTKSVLQCNFFSFSVSKMSYGSGTLQLSISIRVTDESTAPKNFVIKTSDQQRRINIPYYLDFTAPVKIEDFIIDDRFTIYPEDCPQNRKECDIQQKSCVVA